MIAGMTEREAGLLLVIDTSGAEGSIVLAESVPAVRVLGVATMPGRSSSERLVPELRAVLAGQGRDAGQVRTIAVVRGPGSFTGVRIGVAAAKGLAEAVGAQVVGLSRLAVMAASVRGQMDSGMDVAALVDAGRGEVFCGRYRADGTEVFEALLTAEAARTACGGAVAVAFEAVVVEAMRPVVVEVIAAPDAGSAMWLAFRRMRAGEFDDVATLDAHYLRSTAAEIAAKTVRGAMEAAGTGA